MTPAASELLIGLIKMAAMPLRVGTVAMEVAALTFERAMMESEVGERASSRESAEAELDAAAEAIKAKLLAGRDLGFQCLLRTNFPDDVIREIAEAALLAARGASSQPER
jgi:uncharacterized protein YdbL (DUF1318 family)